MNDLFGRCKLEGPELDRRVGELIGGFNVPYSTDYAYGGPLIETNQIFLQPPHDMHVYYGEGKGGNWVKEPLWTATVSAAVRTYPNPYFPDRGNVGRGSGPTALIACMRAIVDSFGEQK